LFRVADENTLFGESISSGTLAYSIESDNMYLCGYNNPTMTINTGVTKLLPVVNGNVYITKNELMWLKSIKHRKPFGFYY
jgi:hypothetical protein